MKYLVININLCSKTKSIGFVGSDMTTKELKAKMEKDSKPSPDSGLM